MANWRIFVPFIYFFSTRLKTVEKVSSWLIIYPISILLVYTTFTDHGTIADVAALSVGMIIVYTSYELGYIANDAFTVSKEINPTLRLSENEISWVKLHWLKIIGVRLVITMVLLGVVTTLVPGGLTVFCVLLLLMCVSFYLYNQTRGPLNIPLHFILVVCRFCGPCMLVMPEPIFLGFTILAFPLINLIERAAEPRYKVQWVQRLVFSNQGSGRWLYYLIVSFLWLGFAVGMGIDLKTTTLLVFLFAYRVVSPLLSSLLSQRLAK